MTQVETFQIREAGQARPERREKVQLSDKMEVEEEPPGQTETEADPDQVSVSRHTTCEVNMHGMCCI